MRDAVGELVNRLVKMISKRQVLDIAGEIIHWLVEIPVNEGQASDVVQQTIHQLIKLISKDDMGDVWREAVHELVEIMAKGEMGDGEEGIFYWFWKDALEIELLDVGEDNTEVGVVVGDVC